MKNTVRYFRYICFFMLMVLFVVKGMAITPNKALADLSVNFIEIKQGINPSTILSFAQDTEGFLWIGTRDQLFKYDGTHFDIIDLKAKLNLKDICVNALCAAPDGTLWIGSSFGLMSCKNGVYKEITQEDGFNGHSITAIISDIYGRVWVSTRGQFLQMFNKGKWTCFNSENGLEAPYISCLSQDHQGDIWVGAFGAGIYKLKGEKFHPYKIDSLTSEHVVNTVLEDSRGILWVGTNRGLIQIVNPMMDKLTLKTAIFTTESGLSGNIISAITEDAHGSIWIGTPFGVSRIAKVSYDQTCIIDSKMPDLFQNSQTMVLCMFEDREQTLWVGTDGADIKRIRNTAFTTLSIERGIPKNRLSLLETANGDIWIGASFGELYRVHDNHIELMYRGDHVLEAQVRALAEDSKHRIWFGTSYMGLSVWDKGSITHYTSRDGLADDRIKLLVNDGEKGLWIGTVNGLSYYDFNTFTTFNASHGLPDSMVLDILEDSKQQFWVATGNGLVLYKDRLFNSPPLNRWLEGNVINAIVEDTGSSDVHSTALWIASYRNGLFYLKNNKLTHFDRETGLGSNFLYAIQEDPRNNLWISSYTGVLKVNKDELFNVVMGKQDKVSSTVFGLADGLKSLECSPGARNSIVKSRTFHPGHMGFATREGLAYTHPETYFFNKVTPECVMTGFSVNGKVIPMTTTVTVIKGGHQVTLEFTAPTFIEAEKVRFRYKLEGYDDEWTEHSELNRRKVSYVNLPYGEYTFHIVASNSNGIWSQNEKTFSFSLLPTFFERTSVRVGGMICIILFLAALIWFGRQYIRLRKIEKKYRTSTLNTDESHDYFKKLQQLMEKEKVFLNENLSLQLLADQMALPLKTLSQVINEQTGSSFWDLINQYRIEEAKLRLINNSDDSILNICYEVGFNSKTAFYRAFKKYTGQTPTAYQKASQHKK